MISRVKYVDPLKAHGGVTHFCVAEIRAPFINIDDEDLPGTVEVTWVFRKEPHNYRTPRGIMLELSVNLQNAISGRKAEIDERGATAVEYALMVGLIAVGIITAVAALRDKVSSTFNNVNNAMGK
jgi:Flp pilus assembly pilin Flp